MEATGPVYAGKLVCDALGVSGADMPAEPAPRLDPAPDLAARQAIAREMQLQTWQDVPYIPLAQVFLPTVYRRDISGVLPGFIKCWNVKKG